MYITVVVFLSMHKVPIATFAFRRDRFRMYIRLIVFPVKLFYLSPI